MKKTFWLYYGSILVGGYRLNENALDSEVVAHALDQQEACPGIVGFPHQNLVDVRRMIYFSRVVRA